MICWIPGQPPREGRSRPRSTSTSVRRSAPLPTLPSIRIECSPAAYISIAANEAEKAASIDIVEVRAVGRFGRFFMSGTESSVETAMAAAVAALQAVEGRSE